MKYLFLLNEEKDEHGRPVGFRGYQPGHKLRVAYAGSLPDEPIDLIACDRLMYIFNVDYPPDYHSRSMSVGDVIVLRPDDGERTMAYAIACPGFDLIAPPITAEVVA